MIERRVPFVPQLAELGVSERLQKITEPLPKVLEPLPESTSALRSKAWMLPQVPRDGLFASEPAADVCAILRRKRPLAAGGQAEVLRQAGRERLQQHLVTILERDLRKQCESLLSLSLSPLTLHGICCCWRE